MSSRSSASPANGRRPRKTTEYGFTFLTEADAKELLAFNRGHWSVENEGLRDVNFRENDSQLSVGPANNATNIACALPQGFRWHRASHALRLTGKGGCLDASSARGTKSAGLLCKW